MEKDSNRPNKDGMEEEQINEQVNEQIKPGQYLAYEREKQGITIEDVASELYLSSHIIRALEEDAYEGLPEVVYVRGYVRSYCRLLRIDPTAVLDMYAKNLPQEGEPLLEDLSLSSPVNERQQRLIMIWGSIAVVSILFILIISWWQENRPTIVSVSPPLLLEDKPAQQFLVDDPDISDPSPPKEVPLISETAPTELTTPPTNQETSSPDAATGLLETESSSFLEPIEVEIKKAGTAGEDTQLNETPHADLDTVDAPDSHSVVGDESDQQPVSDVEDMPQLVTLVVMSSGESWARVRDGGGEIIIHKILADGYNKIFMVNLPLKFEFGNAHQVRLMIDGKDYDFSSHVRPSNTAAFEVSELP